MVFLLFFFQLISSYYSQPLSITAILLYFVTLISLWMIIDAIIQPVRDKVFWIFALIIFAPVTTTIYALKRRGYLTVTTTPVEVPPSLGTPQQATGTPVAAAPIQAPNTVTNQVIRGFGIVLSLILMTGGVMIAGFIVLFFFLALINPPGGSEK